MYFYSQLQRSFLYQSPYKQQMVNNWATLLLAFHLPIQLLRDTALIKHFLKLCLPGISCFSIWYYTQVLCNNWNMKLIIIKYQRPPRRCWFFVCFVQKFKKSCSNIHWNSHDDAFRNTWGGKKTKTKMQWTPK